MAKKQLENIVSEFTQMSIRKAASSVGVSPALVYHIFTDDLHLKSLKFHLWYKLEDRNYEKKPNFSHRFLKQFESTQAIRNMHWWGIFYLMLPVNNQNNRKWFKSNPYIGIETHLNDQKFLSWCAISANRVFGPYYF